MSEQPLMGMSHEEFEKLIEEYIERGPEQPDELEADMFFDALADFVAAPTEVTIELEGKLHDGKLMLTSENPMPPDVRIYDNRITAPGFTFVIRLEQPTAQHGTLNHRDTRRIKPVPLPHPVL